MKDTWGKRLAAVVLAMPQAIAVGLAYSSYASWADKGRDQDPAKPELKITLPLIGSRAHVQNVGWWDCRGNDKTASVIRHDQRPEAKLASNLAKAYTAYYSANAKKGGLMGLVRNGKAVGTSDCSCRLRTLQIKPVVEGYKASGSMKKAYWSKQATEGEAR